MPKVWTRRRVANGRFIIQPCRPCRPCRRPRPARLRLEPKKMPTLSDNVSGVHPSAGDRIDTSIPFVPVHIAVLTVSDTRTKEDDVSGDTLVKRLEGAGHILCARTLLPDDEARIRAQLKTWIADP